MTPRKGAPLPRNDEPIIVIDDTPRDNIGDLFSDTPPKNVPFTTAEPPPELTDGKPKRKTKLHNELEQLYTMAGAMTTMVDQQIGTTIIIQASACAESLDDLAAKNPRVKKALEKMLQTSVYAGVIAAHIPIVVAIATKYVPELRESYESMFTAETVQ